MFVYLSKKISIPQGLKLKSLAWNTQQGWIACGTDHGIVKVLKLQEAGGAKDRKKDGFFTAQSNLSMNQTLEGHQGSVLVVCWNQNYRKLTSSDENGLIIVWILHKGMWFEEMINNRTKSVVRDMRWSSDGRKICIVYDDGHVVLGNVDGNRIWGKELNHRLVLVEWSPDGRLVLFCTKEGKCLIYDCNGNFAANLTICFKARDTNIVGLHWYDGSEGVCDPIAPTLALALQSGEIQLMKHELDEEPVLVNTGMTITAIRWSPNGGVLSVVGFENTGDSEVNSMLQLYTRMGIHMRTLHVSNTKVSALTWEGTGLRLALAVDANIFFANIRHEYKWAFLGSNTCVYSFRKKHHEEHCVMFWDISTGDRYLKYVKRLISVCGAAGYCVLATLGEEPKQYVLILCNAIGNPIESKYMAVEPLFMSMNANHVFVASENEVYVWNYLSSLHLISSKLGDSVEPNKSNLPEERTCHSILSMNQEEIDQICCVCASDKYLMTGRESGIVHSYELPSLQFEGKFLLECRPQAIALNCDSTKLSVIDLSGSFSFFDIHNHVGKGRKGTKVSNFERKYVWKMKWADDNPDLIVIMEKARMYVLRGTEPEEPVSSNAYLCSFHNLQVQAIELDDVMQQPEQPTKAHVFNYETKSLRDTLQILQAVEMQDAYCYVEEHAHPRLWTSLAEHALERLDLAVVEKAFVKCKNFYGIQFLKRLHLLKDKELQKAEVCVYFKRFEDAERLYLNMDRRDLAIGLRMKLGDWFIVEKLVESAAGNDSLLQFTWNNIGDYFSDRQNWIEAETYYKKAKNYEMLAECYYELENWSKLEKLMDSIVDGSPLLLSTARKFLSVGMCEHAVTGFTRGGDVKAAIDCCLELNDWDRAFKLSKMHNCERAIQEKLINHINLLLESGNPAHAIQVHQKAGHHLHAAKLFISLARERASKMTSVLDLKKMHVLAAFEIESHKACTTKSQAGAGGSSVTASMSLEKLLQQDTTEQMGISLENPWHNAEAYHLWMLAHRELYNGNFEQAMKAAWWLREFEDVLNLVDIYSLIALTSFYNQCYEQCSKAFVVLQSLSDIPEEKRNDFEQLAMSIFTKHRAVTPVRDGTRTCPKCKVPLQDELKRKCPTSTCDTTFPICMASGIQILDEEFIKCDSCKHFMLACKSTYQVHCCLCHSSLQNLGSKYMAK